MICPQYWMPSIGGISLSRNTQTPVQVDSAIGQVFLCVIFLAISNETYYQYSATFYSCLLFLIASLILSVFLLMME